MAKLAMGVLGGFSGKVGTVVGSIWKGINTIRAYVANVTNPNSPAQLEHRAKFALMGSFLRPLTSFLRTGFKSLAIKMTTTNAAMKYNLANAIAGVYPDFTIDYPKLKVTSGNLPGGFIARNWDSLLFGLLAFYELVARLTPTEKDNTFVKILTSILNAVVPNFKKGGGIF